MHGMWRYVGIGLLVAAMFAFGGRAVEAGTITVDAGGGADHTTIGAAILAAMPGDTIVIAAGTYSENLVLDRMLTLQGAQSGVCADGRVVGPPNPATETILTAAGGILLRLQSGCAGSVIDGLSFVAATRGIESSSGPIDGVQILNNHFEQQTSSAIFLNDSGVDVTVQCNVVDGTSMGGGGAVHFDQDNFDGVWFLENVIRNGSTGLFCDGTRNMGQSVTRDPLIRGNRFEGNVTGANLGRKAFEFGTISDNVFAYNSFPGLQGGIADSLIADNWFIDNGRGALELTGFGGGADATRGAQRNTITRNFFTGNGFAQGSGAIFFSSSQFPGTISTNAVFDNHICGNNFGASYGGTETIDVTNNIWGHASGPFHATRNPAGLGDSVIDNGGGALGELDFDPWTIDFTGSPCAPQITCPADAVLECGPMGAMGMFAFDVTDARGQAVVVTFDVDGNPAGSDMIAAGGPPTVGTANFSHTFFGAGLFVVTATATNSSGASTSCSFNVNVVDTTPPTVSCTVARPMLWPARNGMIDVGLSVVVTDGCDPAPTYSVEVYSDEPNGSLPYAPDAQWFGSTLKLRMERAYPGGNGRVYLIVVTARDASGNTARTCCTCYVPIMPVGSYVVAVRNEAMAAELFCRVNGAPPPGYSGILLIPQ